MRSLRHPDRRLPPAAATAEGFHVHGHALRGALRPECQLVGVRREREDEYFEGEPVWQGEVLIFDLLGNQLATRCYAWETNGQVKAVLHTGPIDSPLKAVPASILAAPKETQ
jgi:hypothetical protein